MNRKGIILAGGHGTRLMPVTKVVSKHLLPVYDKPMVYYPLATLLLAGIRDILIISNPEDESSFKKLLGDGSQWDIKISFATQKAPTGIPEAYLIAEKFLGGNPSALILGDNFFYGNNLIDMLRTASSSDSGNVIFAYNVSDPERYGILELANNEEIVGIEEKPQHPKSNLAITGLYFLDENASEFSRKLKPSSRGEIEITDLLKLYLNAGNLNYRVLGRGCAWMDMGTPESLLDTAVFIRTIQNRQGLQIASIDEIISTVGRL